MKFKVQRSNLERGLASVKAAVDGKQSLPILKGVKIDVRKPDALILTATNLDIAICVKVEVDAAIDGVTVVDYARLAAVVSSMPNETVAVQVATRNKRNVLELVCGACRSALATLDPADWPMISRIEKGKTAKIDAKKIIGAFKFTRHAFSVDTTRKNLMGALCEIEPDGNLIVIGVDGVRMAIYGTFAGRNGKVSEAIIPAKLVSAILDAIKDEDCKFNVTTDGNMIRVEAVEGAKWAVQGRLFDEALINWRMVVPKSFDYAITADRYELADNFTRASKGEEMAGSHPCVKLTVNSGMIVIDGKSAECEMHTEMPCKFDGEKIEMFIDPDNVVQALNAATDDEVTIRINDGHSPIMIECEESGTKEIIMPLRVN